MISEYAPRPSPAKVAGVLYTASKVGACMNFLTLSYLRAHLLAPPTTRGREGGPSSVSHGACLMRGCRGGKGGKSKSEYKDAEGGSTC